MDGRGPKTRACGFRSAGYADPPGFELDRTQRGFRPVGGERVLALDVLRGFALLGILLVNVELFRGPEFWLALAGEQVLSGLDLVLGFLVAALAQSKFYSIFSFLFGLGLVLQTVRAERRGVGSGVFLARRLAVLGLFGLVHAVFVWSGDILLTYAVLGFAFLLFRRRSTRTLVIWAALMLFVPGLVALFLGGLFLLASTTPEGAQAVAESQAGQSALFREVAGSAERAYGSGSYGEMVRQRLTELALYASSLPFLAPSIFGMFLLGGAVARAGWTEEPGAHRAGIRRAIFWGIVVGLPLSVLGAVGLFSDGESLFGPALFIVGQALQLLGAPFLAAAYMGIVVLLVLSRPGSALAGRFAAVGRMALTNYLLQSLVFTGIFYGLGLYGRVGLAPALLLCFAFFAAQLLFSPLWLRRFGQGPMEALWRRLSYGKSGR
ncbi:putative membrane protein [Rubrobacter radiotolerans]|uniref:DUF418 domain-containing protein n=1 Tax=Rubrobacter radiotolerans TaxID=42256 RepID=A0A023X2R7_RUBRA|nr:DUF418 domain-containing protein [Rubrobacter radiotolerans]AHY46300.1 putative membrane protein [Rubrobacter radiotolerans]MDX5893707.1 DUF418 domain-containing protein [Rubrobacter radiotolerans]